MNGVERKTKNKKRERERERGSSFALFCPPPSVLSVSRVKKMSWKVHTTRKTKRRLAKAIPADPSAGLALAKEIIASLFQHVPHRGTSATEARAAPMNKATASTARPEYACPFCGTMNWCDRSTCRQCRGPPPAGRPAGNNTTGRTMGPRAKALTRTGPAATSPGQQAEALRQAAAAA